MSHRNFARFAVALLLAAAPVAAWSPRADYSSEAVGKAQQEGRVVVLDFHADWCPTCRKQAVALAELGSEKALADVALFVVDFDSSKELRKRYAVNNQSTLVVLRGDREVARATGLTAKDDLRALIAKAL